ncbi:hypothetical protein HZY91_06415 [Facklamia sp. DSM 111018]|uniref:Beta-carotene 15,15'-monooxygenase n=1 Tax=Facklamia lactis TaxID=2749967 RepID=A0ABS0LR26_9LACT|nr:hypothetical protein [Facklamia lactis]MBG9980714.1 hypothetical protein [Facklamia lactis]MBG9986528.1 hypothetical protein [Facklamia lactis]
MFSKASSELKENYGYYIGLFFLQIVIMLIVQTVISMFLPTNPAFLEMATMSPQEMSAFDPVQNVNAFINQYTGLAGVLNLVSMFISTLISVLVTRSVFQKINYSETTLKDSALFNTNPGHALILPFKVFVANLLMTLLTIVVMGVGILLAIRTGDSSGTSLIIALGLFLVMLVIAVIVSPISYLIAYDVERRYNFWTSFTKGISIGTKHFGRIFKTIISIVLLFILFFAIVGTVITMIMHSTNSILIGGILGLAAFLALIFWLAPFNLIYMAETMNEIISQEY